MGEYGDLIDVAGLRTIADLFVPDFVEYRGGIFRSARFERANVDEWLTHLDGNIGAVENVVNHVHLYDVVAGCDDDQLEVLRDIALQLAEAWRSLLAHRFPDRRLTVTCDEGYGPEVTFHQAD